MNQETVNKGSATTSGLLRSRIGALRQDERPRHVLLLGEGRSLFPEEQLQVVKAVEFNQVTTEAGIWTSIEAHFDSVYQMSSSSDLPELRHEIVPSGGSSAGTPESLISVDTLSDSNPREPRVDLYDAIAVDFAAAELEEFEHGMESAFSRQLELRIGESELAAIEGIAHLITRELVSTEVAAEALKSLGSFDDPGTYNYRRWLLARSLRCSQAIVRDAAALGIASLDDPHAIPFLCDAIANEENPDLRADLAQVLSQLEDTAACHSS